MPSVNPPRVVRFAPSPTGRLHIGNIRPAVLNWLYARKHGGEFILRFDDTDTERSKEEHVEAIRADLTWLGLWWDREARQSARGSAYAAAAATLRRSGRLYPCYESEDELERRRRVQLARGLPPVYDRAALRLTDADRAALEANGARPYWRFRLTGDGDGKAQWSDGIRGPQTVDLRSLSDPVLIRADGSFLYTFTSVVDDVAFAVTEIIRGEDHVTNTGVQIDIFHALGATPPEFAHHSLLVDAEGHGLSKRLGSLAIGALREEGYEAMAVTSHAATIGSSDSVAAYRHLDELIARFDLGKLSRAPARFDLAELRHLNARLLHETPYTDIAGRLSALGIGGGAPFWEAVRGNIELAADAARWWRIVSAPIAPVVEDASLCAIAAGLLPPEPFDIDTWKTWTDAVKAATGAKGRALFHPLRLALTGLESGPELKLLLPLIGRQRAHQRLAGVTA